ncbi:unnamed protein product [Brachionus calyciflorus]|uniref:TOG domain-containing protein n=1 Tax=Brachionus calyciflorus TaxID=104777 RepID=A0A813M2Z0_9BILA|nr:unnamed protein product [Brachionus calyciflorus]
MAPMITDSYLNYNDTEFSNSNQKYYNSNKPPLPSLSYSMSDQQRINNINDGGFNFGFRRAYTEDSIIDILRGNNYKQQFDLFEELILQAKGDGLDLQIFSIKNLDEFYSALGLLLLNTISNEVQRICLKFLQSYFKSIDKLKQRRKNDLKLNEKFKQIDHKLSNVFLNFLIQGSVSQKLQLKQISIDLIYSYMKITDDLNEKCFSKFIKYGIENTDPVTSKQFMDPTLCILLTEEFQDYDFFQIINALTKKLIISTNYESSALKCLNKIETILKKEKFFDYINKLPAGNRNNYLNLKNNNNNGNRNSIQFKKSSLAEELEENMKFNLIPSRVLQKLSGEDELQRLQAINQLEENVKNLKDVKIMYPYYQDFIVYLSNFVDDSNYEIRLGSIRVLSQFIGKLGINGQQCYKAICACARNVMSQTHQSKTIRQSLTLMIILTLENMSSPVLILESLMEKIKERSAKTREEILNLVIACVLRYPSDKYESLRKIFFLVSPLLCDIKRNIRHAALESLTVILNRLKQIDRNAGNIIEQLEHVPEFQNFENLNIIKDVIVYRLNRNKIANLNSDMTLEYGVKIPSTGTTFGSNGLDLDIEWIISASSSSASTSNISSARSQRSVFVDSNSTNMINHRIANLNQANMQISTGSFRRPSGTKRLPWEETNSQNNSIPVPKVNKSREVAPLKAFPLNDDLEIVNDISINNNMANTTRNTVYPSTSSYQEKYLKKLQDQKGQQSKTDSQLDLSDISNTAIKLQSEKAISLDNLYNIDDNINSENNVQKRKYANLNLKNGIIPSKPIIPRRNSAKKLSENANDSLLSNNNSYLVTTRSNFDSEIDSHSQFSGDTDQENKFDTAPSIRNSAKNRRKLDKIFSIGPNTNNNYVGPPNANTNLFNSKNFNSNPNISLNPVNTNNNFKSKEENLYLSKLKADKSEMNTSRYSPSNPESGIFSLSDYEQSENRFIKLQKSLNNSDSKKPPNGTKETFNKQANNNIEYSPLAGVSFKQSHSSDVEIVGVKYGNQTNHEQTNQNNQNAKKKNSLKNLNDFVNYNENDNSNNNDMLDVVGRGYYTNNEANFGQDYTDKNDYQSINPEDFPLSLSFRSRLKQKTIEKIEEKHKQRAEKLKANQKKELENLNSSLSTQSPQLVQTASPNDHDYGLSISGYPSSNKPSTVNQQNFDYDDPNDKKINGKYSGYDLSNLEYPDESQFESNSTSLPSLVEKPKFQPSKATILRRARQAAAANQAMETQNEPVVVQTPGTIRKKIERVEEPETETEIVTRIVKEDYLKQPFKNPEQALKEAMNYLSQEDWENKCNAMNIIRRLSVYHEDLTVNNIHSIVLALVQEVKNLRSQVSRFALITFGELFANLKKFMDVDLDIAVKTILQKLSETNEFIKLDVEKCLDKMINNVTTTKAIIAIINGGASHRNPSIRRVSAQYVYKCCELMGPGRILSGIKDVTEKVLVTAAQFVVDGPVDIRWYGRKIFHILMSHEDFDRLLVKYLNEKTRKNIKEILDTIRVKGPGDVPTESARNSRKAARNGTDLISRSAGANPNSERADTIYGITEAKPLASRPTYNAPPLPPSLRIDQQSQEYVKSICAQLRNPDFRERMDAIEKFQILCEQEPKIAVAYLVQLFDKFNLCLTDSNSKVNYKALNTMYLITPLLGDDLNPVMVNVIPLISQNLASKNSEIQDMASNILDVLVEYLEGGSLIQPFANIAIHGNARIKPQIIFKLADLVGRVFSRKQKQVEMHILPALWQLLNSVKGNTTSSGVNSLNGSISSLVLSLYEQMGEQLIDKASNSSSVSSRNLELLKQMITNQLD